MQNARAIAPRSNRVPIAGRQRGASRGRDDAPSLRDVTDWADITAAITKAIGGDREAGREDLRRCWDRLGSDDHAKRCVLAHYLADVQDDVNTEVAWDERALASHGLVGEDELTPIGIPSAAGLAPSLHLNLGDGYLRQGRTAEAHQELEAGLATAPALGVDRYGTMIRSGLEGLKTRLEAHS